MQRIGTAHADAVAAKEKKLEEELRKKEREIRDQQNRRQRGTVAVHKEHQLIAEKEELEE